MKSCAPSTKTLLLVDDVPDNLGLLLDVLQAAGYDVRVAESGTRALQQMARTRPDLVLLDVMMPGLDGLETCRRIKAEPAWRDIPVLFLTALSDVVDKVEGFAAGAVDYLTKPLHPQEVLARVRAHLQLCELRQSLEEEIGRRVALEEQLRRSLDRAVLLAGPDSRIHFLSRRAEQMLARHCQLEEGRLPQALALWLTGNAGRLELRGPSGLLRARRFADPDGGDLFVLLLEEESTSPPPLDPLLRLGLTPREAEVLFWLAQGKTNPEIGAILDTATNTVKKQVMSLMLKLGVETRTAAARVALDSLNVPG